MTGLLAGGADLQQLVERLDAARLLVLSAYVSKDTISMLGSTCEQLSQRLSSCRLALEEEQRRLSVAFKETSQLLEQVNSNNSSKKTVTFTKRPVVDQQNGDAEKSLAVNPSTGVCDTVRLLDEEEFAGIPKYMRGRLTLERINSCVEAFNQVVQEKYLLLMQNPSRLSSEARQRFLELQAMTCDEVAGRTFITEADMKSTANGNRKSTVLFKLDPTGRSILAILRHLGRVKEMRTGKLVRFVVLP